MANGAQAAGIQSGSSTIQIGGQPIPAGGDIVVGIDGRPVSTAGSIIAYIENNKRPGDQVTLAIVRNGQPLDVVVTLGERPPLP